MTLQADFIEQALSCEALGSPFTGRICRMFARNLARRCLVSEKLLDWPGDTSYRGDSLPLRMVSALHALVLSHKLPQLTELYPPQNLTASDEDLWQAIEYALLLQEDFILDWLASPPQTNECARSGPLRAGFQQIVAQHDLPLVLSEVGASAGLNLNWEAYGLNTTHAYHGPKDPVLTLSPKWQGADIPRNTPSIRSRQGCDLNPIDARDPNARLRLVAYIWADQPQRMTRMQAALDYAETHTPELQRGHALDWLKTRLAKTHAGATHVIFSSVAWQYLNPKDRATGAAMIADAGAKANAQAPLAWLTMEGDGQQPGAALTLKLWPGGNTQLLARADFHGRWITWLA